MTAVEGQLDGPDALRTGVATLARQPRDLQRTFLLLLATFWLLDAVLQLQPFMFTPGVEGFSGMLRAAAEGNPGWIAHTITWNASIVDHHPVVTNALFASVQFLIGFGLVWTRTRRAALGLSILWSVAVWWFGEGLGGLFTGGATPFGGGPGGVLFYALVAVMLWPSERPDSPFVAARAVGVRAAKVVWFVVWMLLALLSVVGAGRSPQALHDLVADLTVGEPGWLVHLDRTTESFFLRSGPTAAVLLAVVCLVVAIGVFLPPRWTQVTLVLAVVVFGVIWVAVQDVGGILAGGATDPNAAPLLILFALMYWPVSDAVASSRRIALRSVSLAVGD